MPDGVDDIVITGLESLEHVGDLVLDRLVLLDLLVGDTVVCD